MSGIEETLICLPQFEKRGGSLPAVVQSARGEVQRLINIGKKSFGDLSERYAAAFIDCDLDALVVTTHKTTDLNGDGKFSSGACKYLYASLSEQPERLVATVVQEIHTRQVLMIGYSNFAAMNATLDKQGKITFWSTSHDRLWTKGEESGNSLQMMGMKAQHNEEKYPSALLYFATLKGDGACHSRRRDGKPRRSCFYRRVTPEGALEFLD